MLRAASSNPNEIVFRLMLETDPRYRQQLQAIKKDVVQAQADIIKGAEAVDAKQTQIVERGERKRAAVRSKSIDDFFAEIERQEQASLRIYTNVANNIAANRAAIGGARDIAARNNRIAGYRQDLDRQRLREEQMYQRELERTQITQRLVNTAAFEGFKQTANGAMMAVRAVGLFGIATEDNLEKALRKFAMLEVAVHGVTGAISAGQGIMRMIGAGGLTGAAGLFATGATAAIGAGAALGYYMNPSGESMYERNDRIRREQLQRESQGIYNRGVMNDRAFGGRLGNSMNGLLFGDLLGDANPYGGTRYNGAAARLSLNEVMALQRESLEGYRNAQRGLGRDPRGPSGALMELTPRQAVEEQGRYARQLEQTYQAQEQLARRILDHEMQRRNVAIDTNNRILEGMSRVTEQGREQLRLEEAKQVALRERGEDAVIAYGRATPSQRRRMNEIAGKLNRGQDLNPNELDFAEKLAPDAFGEAARRRRMAIGNQAVAGTEFEKFQQAQNAAQGQRVKEAADLVKAMEQAAAAQRQEMQKQIAAAYGEQLAKIADVVVAAVKGQQEFAEIVEQRRQAGNAMVKQAEK